MQINKKIFFILLMCWQSTSILHGAKLGKTEEIKETKVLVQKTEETPRRLAMFFDYNQAEKIGTDKNAIATRFALNLHDKQEACSCIVAQSVFINFLERRKSDNFYKKIKFNSGKWRLYRVPSKPFFIFIRKEDNPTDDKEGPKDIITIPGSDEKLHIPVFKVTSWQKHEFKTTSTLDSPELLNFAQVESSTGEIKFSLNDLKAIFTTNEDLYKMEEFKAYKEKSKEAQEQLTKLKAEIEKNKPKLSAKIDKLELELKSITNPDKIKNQENFITSLKKELKALNYPSNEPIETTVIKTSLARMFLRPWNIFINGHGTVEQAIAGVSAEKFPTILEFLNNLNTHFVLINTCSSGGKNVNYFKFKEGTPLNLSYFLAIAGISDAPTIVQSTTFGEEILITHNTNLVGFFEELEKKESIKEIIKTWLGEQIGKAKKESISAWLKKQKKTGALSQEFVFEDIKTWLKKVLSHLTLINDWFFGQSGINAIPQVWIPGTGWFSPIETDSTIQAIHNVTIQKYAFENKSIEVKNKFALLIEPTTITVPLIISAIDILKNLDLRCYFLNLNGLTNGLFSP